jgi:dinuclear metal center YbgI/SA1388 family protein
MQAGEVLAFLREFAPPFLSESWDNTGLLVGSESRDVSRIVTCLTLTPDVAQEAVEREAQLVVTHHPVLFRAVQQITDENSEGRMLLQLIEAGIAVYSPHTSYDSARPGINQQLAESLGLHSIQPIRALAPETAAESKELSGEDPASELGSGRFGDLPEAVTLSEFVETTKRTLGVDNTQFVGDPNRSVRRVGTACGAAAEFMRDAASKGCDVLLTGEARFHACLESRMLDIALILPGHYATERPAMESLAKVLGERFPELDVLASRVESDPIQWA